MSFAWLRKARGRVGMRLVIGSLLLLLFSVSFLYGLASLQMKRSLRARDRDAIRTELFEMVLAYEGGGMEAFRHEAEEIATQPGHPPFFIRLYDHDNNLLFEASKRPWPQEPVVLRYRPLRPGDDIEWYYLPNGKSEELELAVYPLSGGEIIYAGTSTRPRVEILKQFHETFLLAALPVFLVALFGGLWLAHRILSPLRRLTTVTRHIIATGEVSERVPLRKTDDELDELAGLFNGMLDRVERLLAGMRETLDYVAHDLRTPMTKLRVRVELALHADDPDSFRDALVDTLDQSDQVLTILNTIMDQAEAEVGTLRLHIEPCSLQQLTSHVVEFYGYIAEERGVALEVHCPADVVVAVDQGRMSQVIANLIDNAVKYTPEGGRVDVEVGMEADKAVIRIRDTGIGIDEDDLPRIWDRLYRCDHSRSTRGLGLGLSLVKSIVEAHGGRVGVKSTLGEGTTFTIRLDQMKGMHEGNRQAWSRKEKATRI